MSKYSTQAASAARMLAKAGQPVTLIRVALTGYDPLNPELTLPTIADQCSTVGAVLPSNPSTIKLFTLDDTILKDPAIRQSFRFVLLAGQGLTFKPQAGDVLKTTEGYYRLLGATPLDPAGDGVILYNVGCTLDVQLDLDIAGTTVIEELVL